MDKQGASGNIVYRTEGLARHFAEYRVTWPQFYESERAVIERLMPNKNHEVLDVGCGCGGLGLALRERFGIEKYTGVDIHSLSVETGREMNSGARFLCGDILEISRRELEGRQFDLVFSLSCVDWNVRFSDMLSVIWEHVRPGGHLISTFRLTTGEGCRDIASSFQYINFEGKLEGEVAAYVVLNVNSLLEQLASFDPAEITAVGYWGRPSATAVTPYDRLCFTAFSLRKKLPGDEAKTKYAFELPVEIMTAIRSRVGGVE